MALFLSSACMSPLDEEEEMAVFESTAAEHGGLGRPRLPEISLISPGLCRPSTVEQETAVKSALMGPGSGGGKDDPERVKVFLRIRPLTECERERGEEQGCVNIQDDENLLLKAPKCSQNTKMAERGISPSMHKFTFSKILGPETTQQHFYECTMKEMVRNVLQGENRLLYTYGVTNSGKTYTVQGTGRKAGLLPRALVSLFRKVQGRLYTTMALKPVLYQDVKYLQPYEVKEEEMRRSALLKEDENSRRGGTSIWDSGVGGLSTTSNIATQLEDCDSVCLEPDSLSHSGGDDLEEGLQFSIWVSSYEIYNEFVYDLLDATPSPQMKKRIALRLSEDKNGNPYVKDLTWIQVRSAEEAWKILRAGRRNQSFASTHLNQNSSRSHSIFSVRVMRIRPDEDSDPNVHISELTVCDLAGTERCKQQRNGDRMREASNINASLLALGRCIAVLRHNQTNTSRPPQVVPFRDSKLTRVLQGFFCGQGTSSMVVNINTCASIYDETLQALKFSAIASQLVHGPSTKCRVAYILSLLREPANGNDSTVLEEETDDGDVEDGDISMLDTESLLQAIDVLKREVHRQREEKELLEANVRKEVVSEMMEVVSKMQDDFNEYLDSERALLEARSEDRIEILQKHLKKFYEQELQERDQEIEELSAALKKQTDNEEGSSSSAPQQQEPEGPRRSKRRTTKTEPSQLREELDQCRAELLSKTQELSKLKLQLELPASMGTAAANRKLEEGQRNLRQLRADLHRLGSDLQSGERACCRNTGGERLRQALTAADETLIKQDQILVELQNDLTLVKADLRRKAEVPTQADQHPLVPRLGFATPGSCKRRGCGAATGAGDSENKPPTKRAFYQALFPTCTPTRKYNTRHAADVNLTPYSRILRSRQHSPPPVPTPRVLRGKY
ncbi:kinesin-like protein KIF20A [Entelurus aequoreus]|uniref:kinesin-like protein KIF20A n=1 Tax=Entelurus aequoreus TaxID=161455 RepID=UPI002B1E89FA|nr:kinesin-like protein KIF20A [Entelurus aequoreus]XP_061890862.1 kinesin-like protein KIF20A [Entelurus aequoreus]XP_061890863.1 kinesin-like protein KIF20A [Entelurus aequoreus]